MEEQRREKSALAGYLTLVIFLFSSTLANGQISQSEWRHIPTTHFSPRNSALEHQTWSIVRDSRGVIYVADKDGIKIFNGTTWEIATTTSGGAIMSLAIDASDRVFYGAQREFGRLDRRVDGRMEMNPISGILPESEEFGIVWAVHILNSEVIFQAERGIYAWDGEGLRSWASSSGFHTSFIVGGKLYVREYGNGFKILKDDRFQMVPGGEELANVRVYMVEEMASGGLLVATQERGLLYYNNNEFIPINSELDLFQKEGRAKDNPLRLYTGTKISENLFAIGTLGKGVVLINSAGQVITNFNRKSGLPDNFINNVAMDSSGRLWLALNNSGIAFLDLTASLVRYGANFGIRGHINGIYRVENELLLSTGAELLKFNEPVLIPIPEDNTTLFDVVNGVALPWDVTVSGQTIFVGTDEGLTVLKPSGSGYNVSSCDSEPTFVLHRSELTKSFLSGSKKGLNRVRISPECYTTAIGEVDLAVWSIVEEKVGEFWLGTRTEGVSKLSLGQLGNNVESLTKYSIANGLPTPKIDVKQIGNAPLFLSVKGPYRFIESSQRFELDRNLWPFEVGETDSLLALTEDHNGNVWMAFPDSVVKAIPNGNGTYEFYTPAPLRFKKASTMAILAEENDVIWFNDGDVLVRYDAKKDTGDRRPYNVLINRVTKFMTDEVLFRGNFAGPDGTISRWQPDSAIPELLFEESELSILYAATSFTSPEELRYQTRLIIGSDSTWSPWTSTTEYRVRSLNAGSYTFQARAKNSEGQISEIGSYSFVILPPWYLLWWAFLMYASFGTLLVYSGGKYWLMVRAHKLAEEQAKDLEKEREFNKVLQEANDRLIKANKLKDEFLATTSHELRTPLTSILGFTSVLKDEIPEGAEYREFLDMIEDSGTRLMETLNSLLDLAKLRSGVMDVNLETCDIYFQCRDGISGLQTTAKRKGLVLSMERPTEPLYVDLDVLGFIRIVYNLVGNAIKFTEEGSVTVCIEGEEDLVHMRIIDTGIGIDSEFLPKLFEEFVQESDGASRTHEGFGLGLAITSRLVRLMSGTISVESVKGKGSVFTVTFPRKQAPLGRPMRMRSFGVDSGS